MQADTPRSYLDRPPPLSRKAQPEPELLPTNAPETQEPLDALSTALLTDMYQITMAYSYWYNSRHNGMLP